MIETSSPAEQTRSLQFLTTVASIGFILTGVVNTFLGPILPALASRWALTDSQSGYFFALQFFGSILGAGFSSVLLPLRGFRSTIALAHTLMAIGIFGLAMPQWQFALFSTFLFGAGFGLVIPSSNMLISSAHTMRRAAALSVLNFCWGLGAVTTPTLVFLALQSNRVLAFLLALSGMLLMQVIIFLSTSGSAIPTTSAELVIGATERPSKSQLAILGGMFFLYVAIEASIGGWISTLAKRSALEVPGRWVLAPSLFWAGLLLGRGLASLFLSRKLERRIAISGIVVAGCGMAILVFTSQWQSITAAAFIAGMGLAAVYPITIALLSRFSEAETRNAGPMFALAGLGGTVMPWMVGAVSTWSGSLQTGLLLPLLATAILLCLHIVGNHGSQ